MNFLENFSSINDNNNQYSTEINHNYNNLSTQLLDNIIIDYMTFSLDSEYQYQELKQELRAINPYLNIFEYDKAYEKIRSKEISKCEEKTLRLILDNFHADSIKYTEIRHRYHLLYEKKRQKNGYITYVVRIPGDFADILFLEYLKGNFDYLSTLRCTRIDFKFDVYPESGYSFEKESSKLSKFYEVQQEFFAKNNINLTVKSEWDSGRQFHIVYIGKRTQRRLIRCYTSGKKGYNTFEIEFKKESSKGFASHLRKKDIFGFNKLLILELYEIFKYIQDTEYTNPVHRHFHEYVLDIKRNLFPDDFLYKNSTTLNSSAKANIMKKPSLRTLINTAKSRLNANYLDIFDYSATAGKEILLLIYCSNLLFEKWRLLYKDKELNEKERNKKLCEYVNNKIKRYSWNSHYIDKEIFKQSEDFYVEFSLKDSLPFLHLANNINSRKLVIKYLKDLSEKKVTFCVNDGIYFQPLMFSLKFFPTYRNETRVGLILHPFIVYDLTNTCILFNNKVLQEYYLTAANYLTPINHSKEDIDYYIKNRLLIEDPSKKSLYNKENQLLIEDQFKKSFDNNYKENQLLIKDPPKKSPYFLDIMFIYTLAAVHTGNGQYLFNIYENRDKAHKLMRIGQGRLLSHLLDVCEKEFDIFVALKYNEDYYIPIPCNIMEQVFMERSDKKRENIDFYFIKGPDYREHINNGKIIDNKIVDLSILSSKF